MGLIEDSVRDLEAAIEGTGCEEGAVILRRSPGTVNCQYEHGVCLESLYGGRSGEFVTEDPVEATTKIAFLFDVSLETRKAKSAACAVLNVVTAFLCISRKVRACPASAHVPCLKSLKDTLNGRRIFLIGSSPAIEHEFSSMMTQDPGTADLLLIGNEGMLRDDAAAIISEFRGQKEILCIGPSTAGMAGLQKIERFCPYGT